MAQEGFDDVVAARTRAVAQILRTPDMLEAYLAVCGSQRDLIAIRDHGQRAETLNLAQTAAQGDGTVATLELLHELAAVQREYALIMHAVRALRGDLAEGGTPPELIEKIDKIIEDQAQVSVRTAVLADGTKEKSAKASKAQEATRAEIERDLNSLIALTEIHEALRERRIDVPRLTALRDRAKGLTGKLATRAVRKGGAKAATKSERDAVQAQSARWAASYGTLAAAGASHAGIAQLLKDAARTDKK